MTAADGARGRTLYHFLSRYLGRGAVRLLTVDELRRTRALSAEWLFIGQPTTVQKEDLAGVRYRGAALFDYKDRAGANWQESNAEFMRSLTDLYLKPWVEPGWDEGLRFGVLPIRRPQRLVWGLRTLSALGRPWAGSSPHLYDVAFMGNGTGTGRNFERIEWLRELRCSKDAYAFWGGLVVNARVEERLRTKFGDMGDLIYRGGRVGFIRYFRQMRASRVALAPGGNAPWTYRHWESIYAGAIVVTTDFRQIKTLIPLPLEGMIHLGKGEPVVPAVDRALALRREHPEVVEENIRFLERYLHFSDYSRKKPELMERFMAQLT